MGSAHEEPLQVLRPVLDTYLNSPLGVTGCRSYGISRPCCEYDLVVVSNEQRPRTSVRNGQTYMDLVFMSEKEVLRPSDPEVAVSLAWLQQIRDSTMTLSAGASANRALLHENSNKAASERLASAVKSIARVDEALTKGFIQDADFWLMAAGYDFARSWILSAEQSPAPSHIVEQARNLSKGRWGAFEAFSKSVGLERASRAECRLRSDAVSILYDVLSASAVVGPDETAGTAARVEFEIVRAKSDYMTSSTMHVDCYGFLGYEVYSVLPLMSRVQTSLTSVDSDLSAMVKGLSSGDGKMIGEQVIRGLGLARAEGAIKRGAAALQVQVSEFAKTL